MSDIAAPSAAAPKSGFLSNEALLYAAIGAVVIVLVAAVAQYGYPLLITLAVTGAFVGLTMIVVLTLIDLLRSGKRAVRR